MNLSEVNVDLVFDWVSYNICYKFNVLNSIEIILLNLVLINQIKQKYIHRLIH